MFSIRSPELSDHNVLSLRQSRCRTGGHAYGAATKITTHTHQVHSGGDVAPPGRAHAIQHCQPPSVVSYHHRDSHGALQWRQPHVFQPQPVGPIRPPPVLACCAGVHHMGLLRRYSHCSRDRSSRTDETTSSRVTAPSKNTMCEAMTRAWRRFMCSGACKPDNSAAVDYRPLPPARHVCM